MASGRQVGRWCAFDRAFWKHPQRVHTLRCPTPSSETVAMGHGAPTQMGCGAPTQIGHLCLVSGNAVPPSTPQMNLFLLPTSPSWRRVLTKIRQGLEGKGVVLAGFVCQLDKSWSYHRERSLPCGNASMRSSCKTLYQLVIKCRGPSPLWVVQ